MRTILTAATCLATLMIIGGCGRTTVHVGMTPAITGSGVQAAETRAVPVFKEIQLNGAIDMVVTVEEAGLLTITGDERVIPLIITEVVGDRLIVRAKQSYSTRIPTKVTVSTSDITAVATNGSGDISIAGVDNDRLSVAVNGSGGIDVAGQTRDLTAVVSGSGDIDAGRLVARGVTAKVAGSGDVDVHATEMLAATIAGSGSIRYAGDARVTSAVAGSGEVRRK